MGLFSLSKKQKSGASSKKSIVDFDALPNLLTIDQVSGILKVHPNTLRNWDRSGKLKATRIGSRKDRRYDRDLVKKFYYKSEPQTTPEPSKEPEEQSYVMKFDFTPHSIKLYAMSRRFSIFVFSTLMVAFSFAVLQVSFFAYIFLAQAEESPIEFIQVQPAELSGWEGADFAAQINLLPTSPLEEFTQDNSAVYRKIPVTDQQSEEEEVIVGDLPGVSNQLVASGFSLPESVSLQSTLVGARVDISLAAEGYIDSSDVIVFSYSLDNGTSWQTLDSFGVIDHVSNITNEGFWAYALENLIDPNQLDDLQVRVEYAAEPSGQETRALLDGIALALEVKPPDPVIEEINNSVELIATETDLTIEDEPVIEVEVGEESFFDFIGVDPTQREVKSIKIVDPSGKVREADVDVSEQVEGDITTAELVVQRKNFTQPGKYSVIIEIEQEGRIEEIIYDFTWGVLALNPDQSLYKTGQQATFSIGALDDVGQIVCNADITLTITDPDGGKSVRSTADGSIEVTDFCGKKQLYEKPDLLATYIVAIPGTYDLHMEAIVSGNLRVLDDSFAAELSPTYTLKRLGPTRVFPVLYQPMNFEVTAYEDFDGKIVEIVPSDFEVIPDFGGVEVPYDTGTEILKAIEWEKAIGAGDTITVGYTFKSPEKSPVLFELGPAKVGDWEELRKWQLAIDPTFMYILATSGTPASGWTTNTTYDGKYLRGAATQGGTGGATTHAPSVSTNTVNASSINDGKGAPCSFLCTQAVATDTHGHPNTNPTMGNANNDPAHYTFFLWKNDTGVPTQVENNTFGFFASAPSGSWTHFSNASGNAQNREIKINNSHAQGGSDTHTHTVTWNSLGAGDDTFDAQGLIDAPSNATDTHTHTAPSAGSTDSQTSVPAYVNTLVYKSTAQQDIPNGFIGLFDADPGVDWDVISDATPYLNNIVRGATTEGGTGGSNTHSHASTTSGVSGTPSATRDLVSGSYAGDDHTHTITTAYTANTDHTVSYANFVLAKCTKVGGCGAAGTVDMTGKAYTSDTEATPITTGTSVCVAVNAGAPTCDATDASGVFNIIGVTTSLGDQLTFFVDGGSILGNAVTVSDGGAIVTGDNLRIYQNSVLVRRETGTSIEILEMDAYDNDQNATDMLYDASDLATDTLVLESGIQLFVYTGHTFDPNGTVTLAGTADLDVRGTAYLDTATNTISGDINVASGGTLNVSGTTNVNGNDVTTSGTLNHTGGTFTIGNGTTEDLVVNAGIVTISGGNTIIKDDVLHKGSGTININTGSNVDLTSTTGVFDMKIGSAQTLNLAGGSLDVGQHMFLDAGTVNLSGGIHRAGVWNDGIVEISRYAYGGQTFNMTGGELVGRAIIVYNNQTLTTTTVTGGTLTIDDLYTTLSTTADWYQWSNDSPKFYSLKFNDTANDFNSSNLLTYLNGDFTITNATTLGNGKSLTVEGDINNGGTYNPGTSAPIIVGGDWNNTGTFTASSSTVTMNGNGTTPSINGTSDTTFNNLTIGDASADTVTINGTDDPTVSGTLDVDTGDTLSLSSGRTLTSDSTLTLDGTISGAGTLIITDTSSGPAATGTLSSLVRYDATTANIPSTTFDARTYGGAVEIYSAAGAARTVTAPTSGTYTFSSTLTTTCSSCTGGLTLDLDNTTDPTVNVTGALTIGATTTFLAPSSTTLTLQGDYTNNGTFTDNSSTVLLSGTVKQTLSGTMVLSGNDFNNLTITNTSGSFSGCATSFTPSVDFASSATISGTYTITTNNVKVEYNSTSTYTVTNINWSAAVSNEIIFRNSVLGSGTWLLNVSGTQTVTYVDVGRSDASGGTQIDASDGTSTDCLNNTNWKFQNLITVGGTVYQENESTNAGTGITVQVYVNGSSEGSDATDASGVYSVANVNSFSGDIVTIFLDNHVTYEGTTAYKSDGTTQSNVDVYQNAVIIRNDTGASISNTNLESGDRDAGDDDIKFNVSGTALTVDSAFELHAWTGDTYDPNGTVTTASTTGDLHILGTMNLDTATNTITGDILLPTGGNLTISGTTNVTGISESIFMSGGTLAISGGTTTLTDDLEMDSGTATITSILDVQDDIDVNGGTLNINAGANVDYDGVLCSHLGSAINFNGGTTDGNTASGSHMRLNGGTITVAGGTHRTSTSGVIEMGRSTTTDCMSDGTKGITTFNMTGGTIQARGWAFYNNYAVNSTTTTGGTAVLGYTGASPNIYHVNTGTWTFYDFDVAASQAVYIHASSTQAIPVKNDFTINTGGSFEMNNEAITIGADWFNAGTLIAETGTVTMTGTGAINGSADTTFNNLTIGDASAGTVTINGTDDPIVSGTLDVDTGDTLSIGSGRSLTWTGSTFTLDGTISGAGRLIVDNIVTLPTTGTLSSIVRFDASNGNTVTMPARTYGGEVEIFNSSTSSRTITMAAGTHNISGDLQLELTSTGHIFLSATANDPAVNITGDMIFTGGGFLANTEILAGAGIWTLSGDGLGNCLSGFACYTSETGNDLIMDGTGKQLSASERFSLYDLTIKGTISISAAGATGVPNELFIDGGTLTQGGGSLWVKSFRNNGTFTHNNLSVFMNYVGATINGTSNTTFYNLTFSESTTLQTSDITIANTIDVDAGDTLTINSGRLATWTGSTFTFDGIITGAGRLVIDSSTAIPSTGILTSIVRFDATNGNTTTQAPRTYGGVVEIYNSGATNRTITPTAASTQDMDSHLYIIADGTGNMIYAGSTNNPTYDIEGDLDFTGSGGGGETITSGTGPWNVAGNVNFSDGIYTAPAGNTLVMDGTGTLTSNAQILNNVTLSGIITLANATHTIDGNFSMAGGTITAGTSTINYTNQNTPTIIGGNQTLNNLTIDTVTNVPSLITSNLIISGNLHFIDDQISPASGIDLIMASTSSYSRAGFGIIGGSGRLINQQTTIDWNITINVTNLRIDATNNNITINGDKIFNFSTVEFYNNSASARTITMGEAAGKTFTFSNPTTLTKAGAGDLTVQQNTWDPSLTFDEALTIGSGTIFQATSSGTLNINRDYTNNGTFTDNSGTVALGGTVKQTLSGAMTGTSDFNNVTITNAFGSHTACQTAFSPGIDFAASATMAGAYTITTGGVYVEYNSGSTYIVSGSINWDGSGTEIVFRNSTLSSGTWLLQAPATQTAVLDVNVARSDASGGTQVGATDASNEDCLNNTNWDFGTLFNVSGTANGNDGATVKIALGASEQAETTTISGSAWTITGVTRPGGGTTITTWVDNVTDANESTAITRYDGGGKVIGMVLDTNILSIGSSDESLNLLQSSLETSRDNADDEDIMHTCVVDIGCDFKVDDDNVYSAEKLDILSGAEFTMDNRDTLTTYDLDINGTLTGISNNIIITTTNNFVNNGTLSPGTSNTFNITGNLTNTGTFTANTSNIYNIGGNYTNSGTYTESTETFKFTATDTGHTINAGGDNIYNLTFDGSGGAWSALTNALGVSNDLIMTNGTFDTVSGTANVAVGGNVQCGATCGTINMTTASHIFTHGGAADKNFGTNVAVATDWTFYNLTFKGTSGVRTTILNGTGTGKIIVINSFSLSNTGTSFTLDNETNDRILDVKHVAINPGGTLEASSTALFEVNGNFTNSGGFTSGTGTVSLLGTSGGSINGVSGTIFHNLTLGDATTTATWTVSSTNDPQVKGTLDVDTGDQLNINNGKELNWTGDGFVLDGRIFGDTSGRLGIKTSAAVLADTGTLDVIVRFHSAFDPTMPNRTYGNDVELYNNQQVAPNGATYSAVTLEAGTHTISGDLYIIADNTKNIALSADENNPTINITGNLDLSTGGGSGIESIESGTGTITVSGNVDLTSGTYTADSGNTLKMDGTSTNSIKGNGNTLDNFTIDPTSASTINLSTSDLIVDGALTVATGDTFNLAANRDLTVTVNGSYSVSGSVTGAGRLISQTATFPSTGTFTPDIRFDATNTAMTINGSRTFSSSALVEFYNNSASTRTITLGEGVAKTFTFDSPVAVSLTTAGAGALTVNQDTWDPTVTYSDTFTIGTGSVYQASSGSALNINDDYTNNGTFTDNGGTVTLAGSAKQTLTGNMTGTSDFYSLTITNNSGSYSGCSTSLTPSVDFAGSATISGTYTITTNNVKVEYNSASTYTVTNINWSAAVSNDIIFRNSNLTAGTWLLNVSGTQAVSYVNVGRSDASSGSVIDADDGTNTDCGNNTNWRFPITISGTSDGANGTTVKVAVNNSLRGESTTISGGSWSITNFISINAGDRVTVFLEDGDGDIAVADESTGITKYDGLGSITGLVLDRHVLSVGSTGDSPSFTMADFDLYNNGNDEDIMFDIISGISSQTLYVDNSNVYSDDKIDIFSGSTFTFNATDDAPCNEDLLEAHDVVINGSLVSTAAGACDNTFTMSGSWTGNGNFTADNDTLVFTATSGTETFSAGTDTYDDVSFTGSGGTFNMTGTTATLTGDISVSTGATVNINPTNTNVNGGAITTAGTGIINYSGTPTVTLTGTGILGGGTGAITFYNFTRSTSGTTTVNSDVSVDNVINIGASTDLSISSGKTFTNESTGSLTLSATGTISGAGTFTYMDNLFFPSTGTVSSILRFDATDNNQSMVPRTYGGGVEIFNSSATSRTVNPSSTGTYTISGNLYLYANGNGDITLTGASINPTMNISGALDFLGTGAGSEIITSGTSSWTVGGSVDFTGGTYTAAGGNTLNLDTSGTLTSAGQTLENLTLSGIITLANATHTVNGNLSMAGGTITAGSSTVTMTGTSNTITGGGQTLSGLTIDPSSAGTITLQTSDVTMTGTLNVATGDTLSISSGITAAVNSTGSLTLSGTISGAGRLTYRPSTIFPDTGAISSILRFDTVDNNQTMSARTHDGDVEIYNNTTTNRTLTPSSSFNIMSTNLYIIGDNTGTITVEGTTNNPTMSISGNLDFTGSGGGTEEIINSGTGQWSIDGNVDLRDGTYTATTGNELRNAVSGSSTLWLGGNELYDYNIQNGASVTVNDAMVVNNDLTIGSTSTLIAPSSITLKGNYSNSGNYTHSSGSFLIAGTGAQSLTGQMTGGADSFYNLTITNSAATIDFNDGATTANNYTITTAGVDVTYEAAQTYTFQNIEWTGATGVGNEINFNSSTTSDWNLVVNGTQTDVSYVDVEYSNACGSSDWIDATNGTNTDTGNNNCWKFTSITISGNVKDNTEAANFDCSADNLTLHLAQKGARSTTVTCTAADGSYSFPNAAKPDAPGDEIAVYIDSAETPQGTTVSRVLNTTSNIAGLDLMDDRLIMRHEDSGPLTNANLSTADDGYAGIVYSVSGANLTVNSGNELHVWTGDTYDPGGTFSVSSADMHLDDSSIAYADTTTSNAGNNLIVDASAVFNIDSTLNVNDAQVEGTIQGTANFNLSGGSLTGNGTVNLTGGDVTLTEAGTLGGNTNWTFYDVSLTQEACTNYTTTASGSGNITITNTLTGASCFSGETYIHVLDPGSKLWLLTGTGTPMAVSRSFSGDGTSTFRYTGSGSTVTVDAGIYSNLELSPTSSTTYAHLATQSYSIYVDATFNSNVVFSASTSNYIMSGSAGTTLDANGAAFYNFTAGISASTSTHTVANTDFSVTNTLDVDTGDTLDIPSGRLVTLDSTGSLTSLDGTISGAGQLTYKPTAAFPTTGTISSILRFDATDNDQTMSARTYGGNVELYSNSVTSRIVTPNTGTHTISGYLVLMAANSGDVTLAGATNNPTVTIGGNLDFTGAGGGSEIITSGTATWTVSGNVTFTDGTYTATSGNTLKMDGSVKFLTHNGQTLHNFISDGGISFLTGNFTINGDLTINPSASLASTDSTLTLKGDYTNNGSFNDNGGTIVIGGTAQQTFSGTMTGGSNFNALTVTNNSGSDPDTSPSVIFSSSFGLVGAFTATTDNIKMRFNAGSEYDFGIGNFTINRSSSGLVYFRSSTPDTQYTFTVLGTDSVSYADVQDSDASSGNVIVASDGTSNNQGNNDHWDFGFIRADGVLYQEDGTTPYNCATDNVTINISVNGDTTPDTVTCTAADGSYVTTGITKPTAAGQHIVVYADSTEGFYKSTTATLSLSAYADADVDMHNYKVLIDHENAGPMTNTLLDTYDSTGDSGIRYTVTTGNFTTTDDIGLHVFTGKSFTPGGTVTTVAENCGADLSTLTIESSATLTMGTNKLTVGGNFVNNGTVSLSATHVTEFQGLVTCTITDGTLTFQNVTLNTTGTYSFNSAATIAEDLTVTTGTLNGTNDIDVNGGDITGDGTITLTGGTMKFIGTGNFGGNTAWTFFNLDFEQSGTNEYTTTATGTGSVTITNLLTLDGSYNVGCDCFKNHTLNAGTKTWTLSGTGTVFTQTASNGFTAATSTVKYTGAGATNIERASPSYYNLNLEPASAQAYTLANAVIYSIGGDLFIGQAQITAGTSTVKMIGTGGKNITGAAETFNNFTIDPTSAATINAITSSFTVSGALNVADGDTLDIATGISVTSTGTTNFNSAGAAGGEVTGTGTAKLIILSENTLDTGGELNITVRFQLDTAGPDDDIIPARTYGSDLEVYTDYDPGAGGCPANEGAMGEPARKFAFIKTAQAAEVWQELILASGTHTIAGDLIMYNDGICRIDFNAADNNPVVNITGNISFPSDGGFKNIVSGTGTWTVTGNADFTDGRYRPTTSNLLVMDNGSSATLTSSTGTEFHHLQSSTALTLSGNTHLNGNLTIDVSKSVIAPSSMIIGGNFDNNGTFTHSSGTIIFDATDTDNTIEMGSSDLNNVTFSGAGGGNGTTSFQTDDGTIVGDIDVNSGDTMAIVSGRIITNTSTTDIAGTGTISGAGRLRFTDVSAGPGTTLTTLSSIVRFDASAANIANTTLDARTYSGLVEIFSDNTAGAARTATFPTGTFTTSGANSNLHVENDSNSFGLTLVGATNNPTVSVGGNLDFTGSGSASETITSGTGIWTVSGNIVFTGGTYTATSGNTLAMDAAADGTGSITSASNVLEKFTVSGATVDNVDQLEVANDFNISAAGTLAQGANVDIILTGDAVNIASGGTFTKAGGTGTFIMDGVSDNQSFEDLNGTKQDMGSVQIGQSPGTTKLKSDFSATDLTILTGDKFETHGWEVTLSDFLDCQGSCTFDLGDDVPNNEGDGTIVDVGGNYTMSSSGTFITDSNDSKVFFNSTSGSDANRTITTGGKAFDDVEFKNAGGTNDNMVISGNLDIDGSTTLTDGELEMSTNNPTVNTAGNVTLASGVTVTKGTGTWTFDGTVAKTYTDNTSTAQNIGTVVFNKTSGGAGDKITLGSDMTVDTADIQTGDTLDLNSVSNTLTLANAGATATVLTVTGTLTPGTSTVKYSATNSAGNIDVVTTTYSFLQFSGTETYVLTGNLAAANGLTGGLNIDSGAILDTTGSNYNIDLAGNWTNNGDFTDNTSTVTLDGTATQTLSGQMTGASDRFYNLTITNAGASNPDVDFAAAADVANNFVANTANTQIEFNASSTYTFQNIDFDGQATGTRVILRSSSTPTQWNINVAGTRSVLNTDVQDSNACGQAPDIDASGGTNKDSTNNDCWVFIKITVSLSANSLNLGTLATSQVNQDGITLTVSTDATNGYSSQVLYDNTLTSAGSDTITDTAGGTIVAGTEEFGASSEKSGYDIGVWSPTSCADTASTSNATSLSTSFQTFAGAGSSVTNDTTVLCFLASVTGTTEAGSYTNTITIVTTGLF